jgi:ferritin-like metal-binding protein YciE
MTIQNLKDLLLHVLQDVHHAEYLLAKALPNRLQPADWRELGRALEGHLTETKQHIRRLEESCEPARLPAIESARREAGDGVLEVKEADARDGRMIAAAQTMKHFVLARYGMLISWANLLGLSEPAAPAVPRNDKAAAEPADGAASRLAKDPIEYASLGERLTALLERKT